MANAAPQATVRPSTVTTAVYLLYVYVVLQVIGAIVALASYASFRDAYTEAFRGTSVENSAGVLATVTAVGAVGGAVIFGGGFLVLAILDGKGKNVARIITWVVAGLAVCDAGYGLISTATGGMSIGRTSAQGPSPEEMQRILKAHLPSWYLPTTLTLGVIEALILILVIVLLALPASNAFFRKQPVQTWEPPVPPVPGS